jgi:hypothetical protein
MYSQFIRKLGAPRRLYRSALFAALIGLCAGLSACNRLSSSSVARDDLSLVPKDTVAIFMVNVKQARGTRVFQKMIEARDKDPSSAREYKEFVQKCSIDPVNEIDSLFLAFPKNAQQSREYVLILRGRYQPDAITNCVRKNAADKQQQLSEVDYNGVHIYSMGERGPQLAVLGKRAVVVAGGEWIRHVIDLHTGKRPLSESARENSQLAAMMKRTRTSDAFWFAGQVPPQMTERLRSMPQFGAAGSLQSISGSVDLGKGLGVHADLDLGSDADATSLHGATTESLNKLRQDSRLQMLGLTSFVDTITVAARKSTFVVDVKMNEQQLEDLTGRLAGLARSLPF